MGISWVLEGLGSGVRETAQEGEDWRSILQFPYFLLTFPGGGSSTTVFRDLRLYVPVDETRPTGWKVSEVRRVFVPEGIYTRG